MDLSQAISLRNSLRNNHVIMAYNGTVSDDLMVTLADLLKERLVANDDVKELTDINAREFLVMALLAAAVLYMGVYPKPFTDVMDASVLDLLKHVAVSKLN